MSDQPLVLFEKEDALGIITINRPERYNAIDLATALQLQASFQACAEDVKIRAILLKAEGKAFCSGQDLKAFGKIEDIDIKTTIERQYNPLIKQMSNLEKPIVCAVQGVAAGAGANLALASDIIIAEHDCKFIQTFVNIGLIPDSGGTYFLPRLVGLARAKAMCMLGEHISGRMAVEFGMIYKSVEPEALQEEAKHLAVRLSQMPTRAIGLTKKALHQGLKNNLSEQLNEEMRLQGEAGKTKDFVEGVTAFIEKRDPKYCGH